MKLFLDKNIKQKNCHVSTTAVKICLLAGIVTGAAGAEEANFPACIAELEHLAETAGVSQNTRQQVIPELRWLDSVVALDRRQPEFSQPFGRYLASRVTDQRVAEGRRLLALHADALQAIALQHGIPPHYLVAFWGLESSFGNFLGDTQTLDSLATLACDSRRSDFFRQELITALLLVDRDHLDPGALRGSWAGALGHTQFMPTTWQQHAIDGDGDGRIDLRGSWLDALASGANYLANIGWTTGERWGREVLLPEGFPYHLTGVGQPKPLGEWSQLGVRTTRGEPLPTIGPEGAILLPSGYRGPAFLVYPNFRVIMQWNRSEFYALSVGILADRIAGAGSLTIAADPQEAQLGRAAIERLQLTLNRLGFPVGEVDGVFGPATRSALREFQFAHNLVADGYPGPETLYALEQ